MAGPATLQVGAPRHLARGALTLAAAFVLACAGSGGAREATLEVVERTPLGRVPDLTETLAIAPTRDAIACAESDAEGLYVVRAGRRVGGPYDGLGHPPTYDPTGRVLAWSGRVGDAWFVQVDGEAFGPYAEIGAEGVAFSPTGGHWGFAARGTEGWLVMTSGGSGGPYEQTSRPILAANGRTAWLGRRDGRVEVVVDGASRGTWDNALLQGFSPDGSRFAWTARDEDGWRVFLDGVAQDGRWEAAGRVAWKADGAAWIGQRDGRWWVVQAGAEHGPYDDVSKPGFAPDGRLAWAERRGTAWKMHVGDIESAPQEAIGADSPRFGVARFAWWSLTGGRQVVWRDLEPVAKVDTVSEYGVRLFGPDDDLAFVARDATGWYARVGDWESPRYLEIAELEVSPTAGHVALVARDTQGWAVAVTNLGTRSTGVLRDEEGGAVERGGGVEFVEPDRVRFTRVEGGAIEAVVAVRP